MAWLVKSACGRDPFAYPRGKPYAPELRQPGGLALERAQMAQNQVHLEYDSMSYQPEILVIDDEPQILRALRTILLHMISCDHSRQCE